MSTYVPKQPNTVLPKKEIDIPPLGEISVQRLIDDGLAILYREIKNLMILSAKGKLDAPSARDLRDHLKLLFELKAREEAALKGMTDEELQSILKQQEEAK